MYHILCSITTYPTKFHFSGLPDGNYFLDCNNLVAYIRKADYGQLLKILGLGNCLVTDVRLNCLRDWNFDHRAPDEYIAVMGGTHLQSIKTYYLQVVRGNVVWQHIPHDEVCAPSIPSL